MIQNFIIKRKFTSIDVRVLGIVLQAVFKIIFSLFFPANLYLETSIRYLQFKRNFIFNSANKANIFLKIMQLFKGRSHQDFSF